MTPARKRTDYAAAAAGRGTAPAGVTALRTAPVRITVDLAVSLHEEIKDWTRQTAAATGKDVPLAEVVRALIRRLMSDPQLAGEIRAGLADQGR